MANMNDHTIVYELKSTKQRTNFTNIKRLGFSYNVFYTRDTKFIQTSN